MTWENRIALDSVNFMILCVVMTTVLEKVSTEDFAREVMKMYVVVGVINIIVMFSYSSLFVFYFFVIRLSRQ